MFTPINLKIYSNTYNNFFSFTQKVDDKLAYRLKALVSRLKLSLETNIALRGTWVIANKRIIQLDSNDQAILNRRIQLSKELKIEITQLGSKTHLPYLPSEIWAEIFSKLELYDLINLGACHSELCHEVHQFIGRRTVSIPKTVIPESLHLFLCAHGKKMRKLALHLNTWQKSEKCAVLEMLPFYCPKLETLDLSNNNFNPPDEASILIEAIARFSSLKSLSLANCQLDDQGCKAFENNYLPASLIYLDLSNNLITWNGITSLCIKLYHLRVLTYLNLLGNAIGELGIQCLLTISENFLVPLRYLNFNEPERV